MAAQFDEVYGENGVFRAGAAKLGLGYLLAVSCTYRIPACPLDASTRAPVADRRVAS